MHELSLVISILDIVKTQAAEHGFKRVNSLKLSMGHLYCVEPKALEFAFDIQSKGTVAEGAVLEFERMRVSLYCFSCKREVKLISFESLCPVCGTEDVVLVGGTEELKLVELDVD
jgi:hydrogenase nickel incorporation protein HypA/HybF